jgi:hypothetical protein
MLKKAHGSKKPIEMNREVNSDIDISQNLRRTDPRSLFTTDAYLSQLGLNKSALVNLDFWMKREDSRANKTLQPIIEKADTILITPTLFPLIRLKGSR